MYWKREMKRKDRINHTGHYALNAADGHDMDVSDPENQEDHFWEINDEFYYLVVEHCKANPDVDVDAHENDGAADSESDNEEL